VKNILYNEHGQRTEIDYGNNVVTKYAYDDENLRLKTIETTKGGRTIQSLTYDYDDTGNVTRRSNDGFQTKDDNRKFAEHNYEYDSLNRLVKAKGSYTRSGLIIDNMLQKYDTKYDYTPGGNITRKKQSAWGVGTEGNSITDVNLSYDNEYKYDSPKPHAVTKVGSTEYTYDLDGRMTGSYDSSSKFKRTFTWDEEGRLLKTVDNKHTTDYRYDANGERICKYSDLGETIYASGYYTETDGKKISKHIYIGSTRVASQVMSRTCETSTTMKRENILYYHTDHLGSSGYVTDKKGEFYEHTEYTSSGESWVNEKVTGNANLPYKYTGKEMDAETGLYYHGARYRDAKTGVWLSVDPYLANGNYFPVPPINDKSKERNKKLPGMGGVFNSVNLNAYHYAGNNPVKYIDPDGRTYKVKGSSGDIKEFTDQIYKSTGYKVQVNTSGELKIIGTRNTSIGSKEVASEFKKGHDLKQTINIELVNDNPYKFIDQFKGCGDVIIDIKDLKNAFDKNEKFGAAQIMHVISEQIYSVTKVGTLSFKDAFTKSHDHAIKMENSVMGAFSQDYKVIPIKDATSYIFHVDYKNGKGSVFETYEIPYP